MFGVVQMSLLCNYCCEPIAVCKVQATKPGKETKRDHGLR